MNRMQDKIFLLLCEAEPSFPAFLLLRVDVSTVAPKLNYEGKLKSRRRKVSLRETLFPFSIQAEALAKLELFWLRLAPFESHFEREFVGIITVQRCCYANLMNFAA